MTPRTFRPLLALAMVCIVLRSFAQIPGDGIPADGVPADAVWIDVRTPGEYAQGHLEGAISIPFDGIEAGIAMLRLPEDAAIYLYCASGRRSAMAKERLEQQSYSDVTNVGGLDDARRLVAEQPADYSY